MNVWQDVVTEILHCMSPNTIELWRSWASQSHTWQFLFGGEKNTPGYQMAHVLSFSTPPHHKSVGVDNAVINHICVHISHKSQKCTNRISGQMVFCVVVDFCNAQAFLFSTGWQRISEPYACPFCIQCFSASCRLFMSNPRGGLEAFLWPWEHGWLTLGATAYPVTDESWWISILGLLHLGGGHSWCLIFMFFSRCPRGWAPAAQNVNPLAHSQLYLAPCLTSLPLYQWFQGSSPQ